MSLPSHLSPTILAASLNLIAPLLQIAANTNEPAARQAATALLEDHNPQTNQELALAGEILHYRALAADTMMRSRDPELPLTTVLRLRGNGVALSRESHKAQRKLDKLQAGRTAEPRQQDAGTTAPAKAGHAALDVASDITNAKPPQKPPTAEQLRKQAMARTIRDNAARNAAAYASRAAAKAA